MGGKRKKDKHLPTNVCWKHGRLWYVKNLGKDPVTKKRIRKWINLGTSESEALGNYGKIVITKTHCRTMNDLFDRYLIEIAPKKAPDTFRKNAQNMKKLRMVFGDMPPYSLKPIHIYGYLDKRSKQSASQANNEKSLLSSVLSYAIKWGVLENNVCMNVKPVPENKKPKRYVEDWEYRIVYNMANPVVRVAMLIAVTTGLRQADILKIKLTDLRDEGLYIKIQKTQKEKLYKWNDDLKEAINMAKALKRKVKGFYLLGNKNGQRYTRNGFSSMYKRIVKKALEEGKIKQHFNFHDLRRKAGTDAERLHGREYARTLLDHTTQKMTGAYISGIQTVEPLNDRQNGLIPDNLEKKENVGIGN